MIYFWNPASVNKSQKLITTFTEATMPKIYGASTLARIILVIGVTNLATISVKEDHFVAEISFELKLLFK